MYVTTDVRDSGFDFCISQNYYYALLCPSLLIAKQRSHWFRDWNFEDYFIFNCIELRRSIFIGMSLDYFTVNKSDKELDVELIIMFSCMKQQSVCCWYKLLQNMSLASDMVRTWV